MDQLRSLQRLTFISLGCRHCSVVSSAPSVLPPRVWVSSTPSTLSSIYWSVKKTKIKKKRPFIKLIISLLSVHHSSVVLFAPSVLPPRVWVPSTPSTLLSIYIWIFSCEKDKNKQKKRPGLAHLKNISPVKCAASLNKNLFLERPNFL